MTQHFELQSKRSLSSQTILLAAAAAATPSDIIKTPRPSVESPTTTEQTPRDIAPIDEVKVEPQEAAKQEVRVDTEIVKTAETSFVEQFIEVGKQSQYEVVREVVAMSVSSQPPPDFVLEPTIDLDSIPLPSSSPPKALHQALSAAAHQIDAEQIPLDLIPLPSDLQPSIEDAVSMYLPHNDGADTSIAAPISIEILKAESELEEYK